MNDYINYYDLLGISKNASEEEIKKAYRNQAKKWHPDLNKDPKAPEMAKKINEAKEILLDENKRKEYDIYLENYKSGIYDNLNKKTNSNTNNTNNSYNEKTYTKWEYFILYLKYYNVNIFRKIFAVIFVLLESILCTILQIINYTLAFIISFLGYILTYVFSFIGGLFLLIIVANLIFQINEYSSMDYVELSIGAILFIVLGIISPILPYILVNKTPILISKLNMFLFKKSIGYKN